MEQLKENKQHLLVVMTDNKGFKKRITKFELFFLKANNELTEYNKAMVRKYIPKIKVHKDKI